MAEWTVKNDPVKAEWVVVTDGEIVIPIHPYKDWKSNADLARLIATAIAKAKGLDS